MEPFLQIENPRNLTYQCTYLQQQCGLHQLILMIHPAKIGYISIWFILYDPRAQLNIGVTF